MLRGRRIVEGAAKFHVPIEPGALMLLMLIAGALSWRILPAMVPDQGPAVYRAAALAGAARFDVACSVTSWRRRASRSPARWPCGLRRAHGGVASGAGGRVRGAGRRGDRRILGGRQRDGRGGEPAAWGAVGRRPGERADRSPSGRIGRAAPTPGVAMTAAAAVIGGPTGTAERAGRSGLVGEGGD